MKRYPWSAAEDKEKLKEQDLKSREKLATHIRIAEMNILQHTKRELLKSLVELNNADLDSDCDSDDDERSEDWESGTENDNHTAKKLRKQ